MKSPSFGTVIYMNNFLTNLKIIYIIYTIADLIIDKVKCRNINKIKRDKQIKLEIVT